MVAVEEPPFCDACTVVEAQGANLPLELEWRPGEGLVSGTPIDLAGRLIDDVAQGLLAELRFALRRLTVAHGKVEIVLEEWTASRAAVELAARLAARTHVVEGEADAALAAQSASAMRLYRGSPDRVVLEDRRRQRASEILAMIRAKRAKQSGKIAGKAAALMGLLVGVMGLVEYLL